MPSEDHPARPRINIWQRPLPLQRQESNRNDFIDKDFNKRLKSLPNILPQGLEWLEYKQEMCDAIAEFYHQNFMLGAGPPPHQFREFISHRMGANPPNLILMLADTESAGKLNVTMEDGRSGKLVGMMLSEAFDVVNQGRTVPVLTVGGLAISQEWRGFGLVLNFVKQGASKLDGEYMHLFNLKKDRRLFPCAELSAWWYPLKSDTALKMTLFKLDPGPPMNYVTALCNRINKECAVLPCRSMEKGDVGIVCGMLNEESNKYALARIWTPEHVARWLLPRDNVQFSYIVTDDTGKVHKDFFALHVMSFGVDNTGDGTDVIKVAVPGYITTQHTKKEDMLKYMMYTAKREDVDYIHGYGAFEYEEAFKKIGFIKNDNEVHYVQMFNWESRTFKGSEMGLAWIQF